MSGARKVVPTHKAPAQRPTGVNLFALPHGGFLVRDPLHAERYVTEHGDRFRMPEAVAFSTLEELLGWLRIHMARPAEEPTAAVER